MYNPFDNYKEQIIKIEPLNQTMAYDYDNWEKWLNKINDNGTLKKDLYELNLEFKGKISRRQLIDFAHQANMKKTEESSVQFFLACMIWGYGGDTSKNSDHRGPFRVQQIFNSSNEVRKIILESFISISSGNIEKSFKEAIRIKGLSISFLSKFLYFASRGCNIDKYALIFDVRVAKSLIKLTSNQKDIVDIVTISPSINYKDFKKYLDFAHVLAKRYSCEAENIELFLFEQAE